MSSHANLIISSIIGLHSQRGQYQSTREFKRDIPKFLKSIIMHNKYAWIALVYLQQAKLKTNWCYKIKNLKQKNYFHFFCHRMIQTRRPIYRAYTTCTGKNGLRKLIRNNKRYRLCLLQLWSTLLLLFSLCVQVPILTVYNGFLLTSIETVNSLNLKTV